jgi:hypothetical protein
MQERVRSLTEMRVGILFALLTLIYGFGLGGVFGAFEDSIKGHLESEGKSVLEVKYNNDASKMASVTSKSWTYFKRAHLHANGLGTSALVLILLLSYVQISSRGRGLLAMALGLGSFGYSTFWMFAGLKAPSMGGTGAAKESLQWLAIPSSGMCIVGLVLVAILILRMLLGQNSSTEGQT